jgi:hypothetical protein
VPAGEQLQPGPDGAHAGLPGRPHQEPPARGRPQAARGHLLLQGGRPLLPLHGHAPHLQECQQEGGQGQGHQAALYPGQVRLSRSSSKIIFVWSVF